MTERERIQRRKQRYARARRRRFQATMAFAAGFLAIVLCVLLFVLFLGGEKPKTELETTAPSTQTVPTTQPTTVPTEPTEPPLTYPPDATPQQMLEAFMEYYDLSLTDYPQVVQEAFATSKENIDYLLNFPLLRDEQYEVDISGYDISQGVTLFIQWDVRWGYLPYAGNYAGLAACGPTCLSMVAYYLTGDPKYTPVYMMEYAEANGYCGNRQGTYWTFFTEGAVDLGFIVKEEYKTERKLILLLQATLLCLRVMRMVTSPSTIPTAMPIPSGSGNTMNSRIKSRISGPLDYNTSGLPRKRQPCLYVLISFAGYPAAAA